MLLLDLTHTSHTRARTGVQRVCREVHRALARKEPVTTVTHDPFRRAWRLLNRAEQVTLSPAGTDSAAARGARWPQATRWRGRLQRWLRLTPAPLPSADALVVPEIFSPTVADALPGIFAHVTGPRVAVFHDAIALQLPALTPPKSVARFPAYLRELSLFDGIAAVSDASREALLGYWQEWEISPQPPVVTIPLGLTPRLATPPAATSPIMPVVLCVGTLEGRKNHVALLEAAQTLWDEGLVFSLHLIGMAHPQTGRAALERVAKLQAAGHPLRYDGPVDDAALARAYAEATFTVYPSLLEGFGLPVLESLQYGKPCLCSSQGALGESAREGGCLTLDPVDAPSLAAAIRRLLTEPATLTTLTMAAQSRTFRTWDDYAADLLHWMKTLPISR